MHRDLVDVRLVHDVTVNVIACELQAEYVGDHSIDAI